MDERINMGSLTETIERYLEDLTDGIKGSTDDWRRSLTTLGVSTAAFLLSLFSANPGYSVQMLSSGVQYWWIAFLTRFTGMLMNTGYTGILLTGIFSLLVGITMTNTVIQIRRSRLNMDAVGALPGFLAGGCASCGVGVLSVLGLGGVLATLPFEGNLIRLGGVALLTALVVRTGDPDTCEI